MLKLYILLKMKVYIIWLIGVIAWNFGVPKASPLEDVLVAIVLSFISMTLSKYIK
ncbi:hypothetical protein OAJ03_04465 [Candidatus Pelagibacter sp.]|nr:hypothetical protein [Candidatus Pelagibacter sp.]